MEITRDTTPPVGLSATIYCDGSCPSNPGPMGIGYLIWIDGGETIRFGTRFGDGSNNVAEYLALIWSLRHALRAGITHVKVFTDSQLMKNQIDGVYACRDGRLKPLLEEARGLVAMFTRFDISHTFREDNEEADFLSKNPTDTEVHLVPIIDLAVTKPRKLTRQQAAMVRWWWKTRRCQNEYRLARIFLATPSHMGRIGRGEQYTDITQEDLPHAVQERRATQEVSTTAEGRKNKPSRSGRTRPDKFRLEPAATVPKSGEIDIFTLRRHR